MHDLLIQGGTVVDPSQGIHGVYDVAIDKGVIKQISASIAPDQARQIVRVTGKLVVPGLIDLHTHVYDGVNAMSVNPDEVGVYAGVTTVVDAGSAGPGTFGGFPRYVIPSTKTELFCFLNMARTGFSFIPEIRGPEDIDTQAILETVEMHRSHIQGIKFRMVSPGLKVMGVNLPVLAKKTAKEAGLPLMVHIGDTESTDGPILIRELLSILEPGDILTHLFTPQPGGVLDFNGKLLPEVREAVDRGVIFDTGHGRFNFSFEVGERILDQGLTPHCISSDITLPGRAHPVHSMVEMLTRFLAMGVSLDEVISMATLRPAQALNAADRLGNLAPGSQADVSILDIVEGCWKVQDTLGASLPIEQALVPSLTIKRGEVFTPHWGPRLWGWLPNDPNNK